MRASTCRICLRAASFSRRARHRGVRRRWCGYHRWPAPPPVRNPAGPCRTPWTTLRRARSRRGSSSASRSRRRNDDGVGQIFMPEKSSRSRASSTFRRRLSMAQQVLATRSACSSSGSAPPASPSRSRETSCRRNAATSVRAASRSETTDPSSVAINLSTDSSRPSILDCPHSSRNVARMWSGIGPRSCFRFTTGAGCVRPHRRAPSMAAPVAVLVVGLVLTVLEEQVDRLRGVHYGNTVMSLDRVRIPRGAAVGGRLVRQVRQAPRPALRVAGHDVVPVTRRLRRCGSVFPGRGCALVLGALGGFRLDGRSGGDLDFRPEPAGTR